MKKIIKKIISLVVMMVVLYSSSLTVTAAPTSSKKNADAMSVEMLEKVNTLRESYGLEDLAYDSELVSYAETRAKEVTKKFSHTRPDGTQGYDIIPLSRGYAGENLAMCTMDNSVDAIATELFTDLKNSPTHLENMVAPEYENIGIASVEAGGIIYIVFLFAD